MKEHSYINRIGIMFDGFISTVQSADISEIAQQVKNWASHLHKYGVEV
jgi:hypothetical protein